MTSDQVKTCAASIPVATRRFATRLRSPIRMARASTYACGMARSPRSPSFNTSPGSTVRTTVRTRTRGPPDASSSKRFKYCQTRKLEMVAMRRPMTMARMTSVPRVRDDEWSDCDGRAVGRRVEGRNEARAVAAAIDACGLEASGDRVAARDHRVVVARDRRLALERAL